MIEDEELQYNALTVGQRAHAAHATPPTHWMSFIIASHRPAGQPSRHGSCTLRVPPRLPWRADAMSALSRLHARHPFIGDVRGEGLMIGVEFVADRETRAPHPELAKYVMSHMRANRVLVSVDGPHASVVKMKPPVCVTAEDMDRMTDALDAALHDFRATQRSPPRANPAVAPATGSAEGAGPVSRALPALSEILRHAGATAPSSTTPASSDHGEAASSVLASMLHRQNAK